MTYKTVHGEGSHELCGKVLHYSSFNLDWLVSPKVILDIGAYDFGDSVRFKNRFPDCEVHSFEMLKSNYDKHSEFAQKLGIKANYVAISDKVGETEFYQGTHVDGINGQSTLLKPTNVYTGAFGNIVKHEKSEYTIPCTTVEQYCIDNNITEVDLAHIDVEGAEYQVISGFGSIKPKMVFAEFLFDGGWENQKSYKETLDFLCSIGYNVVGEFDHDKLFMLK